MGMTFTEFEDFLFSKRCFENHDVSYIDIEGNQHYLDQTDYMMYQIKVAELIVSINTIKVEQCEQWFNTTGTAHIFYNKENGPSFGVHTDPVDVIIECLDGTKYMEIEGKEKVLKPKGFVHILAGTNHRALNYEKALMISYGASDTETLTRIR